RQQPLALLVRLGRRPAGRVLHRPLPLLARQIHRRTRSLGGEELVEHRLATVMGLAVQALHRALVLQQMLYRLGHGAVAGEDTFAAVEQPRTLRAAQEGQRVPRRADPHRIGTLLVAEPGDERVPVTQARQTAHWNCGNHDDLRYRYLARVRRGQPWQRLHPGSWRPREAGGFLSGADCW